MTATNVPDRNTELAILKPVFVLVKMAGQVIFVKPKLKKVVRQQRMVSVAVTEHVNPTLHVLVIRDILVKIVPHGVVAL